MKKLAILIALMGGPVGAQDSVGNVLLRYCKIAIINKGSAEEGYCLGYIVGAYDGLLLGSALALDKTKKTRPTASDIAAAIGVCMPANVDYRQTVDIVANYLEDHPETRHENSTILIQTALKEAFPCQ